jgi:hypothetical protein
MKIYFQSRQLLDQNAKDELHIDSLFSVMLHKQNCFICLLKDGNSTLNQMTNKTPNVSLVFSLRDKNNQHISYNLEKNWRQGISFS